MPHLLNPTLVAQCSAIDAKIDGDVSGVGAVVKLAKQRFTQIKVESIRNVCLSHTHARASDNVLCERLAWPPLRTTI